MSTDFLLQQMPYVSMHTHIVYGPCQHACSQLHRPSSGASLQSHHENITFLPKLHFHTAFLSTSLYSKWYFSPLTRKRGKKCEQNFNWETWRRLVTDSEQFEVYVVLRHSNLEIMCFNAIINTDIRASFLCLCLCCVVQIQISSCTIPVVFVYAKAGRKLSKSKQQLSIFCFLYY